MRAIITGGGTGGHIYPAIAVALELKKRGWDIIYIGSKNGLEKDIAQEWDIKFKGINVAPLPRKFNFDLFKSIFTNLKGLYQSFKIIKNYQTDIVFGTGGFVAGSVVLAGFLTGKSSIIHEQNAYPGITNKILSRFCDKVAINFKEAKNHFSAKIENKIIHTGNPVREIILKTEKKQGIDYFKFSSYAKTILIFGGSQGAESINKSLSGIYKFVKNNDALQLIHITGKKNYKKVLGYLEKNNINIKECSSIKTIPYLEHMEYAYSIADIVISRAGATALSEITAKGLASILIPYPYATDNHQKYNAQFLTKNDAARMIEEKNLNEKVLLENLKVIINNESLLKEMSENSYKLGKRDAVTLIANKIEKIGI
ncbi:MAG TPA: undecaprenyldiphospho-muramoylpentapeptide beta-N-acetylglucosaminyltransferase [Halanaerobiales bacterium]|nr:undecaprenyldiphospho-muramoylpentapeptide beta-N-acetylglucosaminyltransferase [Halanaerobiales bacterium]